MTTETNNAVATPTTSPVVQAEPGASVSVNNTSDPTIGGSSASTDPTTSPVAQPSAPAADPASAATTTATAADPSKATIPPMPTWAQERINTLTYHRREAERQAEEAKKAKKDAEDKLADVLKNLGTTNSPAPATPPANGAKSMTQEEIDRIANERAAQIAAARMFNDKCDTVAETGKKELGADWDNTMKNLTLVGAVGQNAPIEFLQTAIELQAPHKVLNYLGQQEHLEETERLMKLPLTKMALELARIEAKVNAPAPAATIPVSSAPAPVIPVVGKGAPGGPVELNDSGVSMDQWMAERAKQIEARRTRYQR